MHKFNAMGGNSLQHSPARSLSMEHIIRTYKIGFTGAKFAVRGFTDQPKVRTVYMPFPPRFKLKNAVLPWTLLSVLDDGQTASFSGPPADSYVTNIESFMSWPILFWENSSRTFEDDELRVRYITGYEVNIHGCFILDFDPARSGKIWVADDKWCHREDNL